MAEPQDAQEWDVRYKTVFPFILDRLKTLKAQTMLDYGCGRGVFMKLARTKVPGKMYGYDLYPEIRDFARKNISGDSFIIDDMRDIPRGSVDVATMNAVWMQFPDEKTCMNVFKDINAALKPDGTLIASFTHPCFRDEKFVTHETDFSNKNYLRSGTPFTVSVGGAGAPHGQWKDFHWTMSDHINQLIKSGFTIISATEMPDDLGPCQWMILEARKG